MFQQKNDNQQVVCDMNNSALILVSHFSFLLLPTGTSSQISDSLTSTAQSPPIESMEYFC